MDDNIPPSPLAVPTWNQLDDPLPDSQPDPYASADCGEECVSMALRYYGGPELSAGAVRVLVPGHQARGETTAEELADVAVKLGLWASSYATQHLELRRGVEALLGRGMPALLLGYWDGEIILHWIVAVQSTPSGLTFNDPWHGVRRTMGWTWIGSNYAGWVVGIGAGRWK